MTFTSLPLLTLVAVAVAAAAPPHIAQSWDAGAFEDHGDNQFLSRGKTYGLSLTTTGATLALAPTGDSAAAKLTMQFPGMSTAVALRGEDHVPGTVHSFLGTSPASWKRNAKRYRRVRYSQAYPSIDIVFYEDQNRFEYDFIVAPGGDPNSIAIAFDTPAEAAISSDGSLQVAVTGRTITIGRPNVYQQSDAGRRAVDGEYFQRSDGTFGIALGSYDPSLALVIDPVLSFLTYLGGSGTEFTCGVTVDTQGAVYVAGFTMSFDLPATASAVQPYHAGGPQVDIRGPRDVFVAKIDPATSQLIFLTHLGGTLDETCGAITLGPDGNIYVGGQTNSADFPVFGPDLLPSTSKYSAFLTALAPTGDSIVYSDVFGGNTHDSVDAIAFHADGSICIAGSTASQDFPATVMPGTVSRGYHDSFVARLDLLTQKVAYSVIFGGSNFDQVQDIDALADGSVAVVGWTSSADFPTRNAFQASLAGEYDSYVVKLTPTGDDMLFSTYLGGAQNDLVYGMAVDASENIYLTGYTLSAAFPTLNGYQATYVGGGDSFLSKFASDGTLSYSTFIGGTGTEFYDSDVAVDLFGRAYVTGLTHSTNFPVSHAVQNSAAFPPNAYLVRFNPSGSALEVSTYLGGDWADSAKNIHLDDAGIVTIVGDTTSPDLPGVRPVQERCNNCVRGASDLFIAQFDLSATLPDLSVARFDADTLASPGGVVRYSLTADNNSSVVSGLTSVDLFISDSFPVTSGDRRLGKPCAVWPPAGGSSPCLSSVVLPNDLPPGRYYLAAGVDMDDQFTEAPYGANLSQAQSGPLYIAETSYPRVVSGGAKSRGSSNWEFKFADTDGAADLTIFNVLVNDFLDGRSACYVAYSRVDNRLYLVDDNGSSSQSGLFGAGLTLSNSQCTIYGTGSSLTLSGNTATLILRMYTTFPGDKVIYAAARDAAAQSSGWQAVETVRIEPQYPEASPSVRTERMHPGKGSGTSALLHVYYRNREEQDRMRATQVLINSDLNGIGACYLGYDKINNLLYLVDDDGFTLRGPIIPGSGTGLIENSQCAVYGARTRASSVISYGEFFNLAVELVFKPGFEGPKVIYTGSQTFSSNSGWQSVGHWTVP